MSSYLATILFGTAALTYLIRLLPFLNPRMEKIHPLIRKYLTLMPIAALGALIFPGVLTSFPDDPFAGVGGVIAAALTAWFVRGSLILPVVSSVGASWLILHIF